MKIEYIRNGQKYIEEIDYEELKAASEILDKNRPEVLKKWSREEHIERHKLLHKMLDELLGDMCFHTDVQLNKDPIFKLMQWSHKQTINPDRKTPYNNEHEKTETQ